jgi:aldehyde dehydrogenase (NAD+)
VADQFLAEAKRALVEMFGRDPKNNPDYSRIISTREAQRLQALIDQSKVVAGGDADAEARYVAPTILYPITWEHEIMEMRSSVPSCRSSHTRTSMTPWQGSPTSLPLWWPSSSARGKHHIDGFIGSLSYGGGAVNQVNRHRQLVRSGEPN